MGGKGKGAKKQAESEEFDAFLKDLQTATKETGAKKQAAAKKKPHALTKAEMQQKHKQSKLVPAATTSEGSEEPFSTRWRAKQQQQQQQQKMIQQLMQQLQMGGGMGGFGGMGSPYLPKPNEEFKGFDKTSAGFDAGSGSMQGWRRNMEDAEVIDLELEKDGKTGLFAVFDGHAGEKCALKTQEEFPALARKHYKDGAIDFTAMYKELDEGHKGKLEDDSGCTAVSVLVTPKQITCANVGDSRAVLCRGGKTVSLSEDHKPENELEKARIEASGGFVENNRTNGQLAMSRAIGDFVYKGKEELAHDKQAVIAVPEIMSETRTAEDEFLVVACDGIFDVMTNEEVVDFVRDELKDKKTTTEVCEALINKCLAPVDEESKGPARPVGTDNMTATVIKLL